MPEMVEVVKNQDKRSGLGYAGQSQVWRHGLTSDYGRDAPSAQMEFLLYTHVIGSPTELFKP